MNRQRIRNALIRFSFFIFPITFFYFSPALIFKGARFGIITGSFITFCMLFISSLFLGRAFCGWICPGGGLCEILFRVNSKKTKKGKPYYLKYLIWIIWLGGIVAFVIMGGGYHKIDPLMNTYFGISLHEGYSYIAFSIVLTVFIILSLVFGKRAICHYGCWMAPFMIVGTSLRDFLRLPGLRIRIRNGDCNSCKICVKNCPMSIDVLSYVKDGMINDPECILCGLCVDSCPQKTLSFSFSRYLSKKKR